MSKTPKGLEELTAKLKDLSHAMLDERTAELSTPQANRIRRTIESASDTLRKIIDDLDPIKHPGFVFDPSNPEVAGRIVGITLIAQDRKPLDHVTRFYGSGVYAIYYNGDFEPYSVLSGREHPIYVGKADPAKPTAKTARDQGEKLAGRLNEHRKNIKKATTTLRIEDFEYRALVVQTGWQASAETYLIDLFKPIWNSETGICYGFGKHGDDPATRANLRSPWDTMHPGRDWAHRDPTMKDASQRQRIVEAIAKHLEEYPPITDIDSILRTFLKKIREVS